MPRPLRADIDARQVKVAAGLLARKTERAMAREIGVSLTTVHRDVAAVRAAWRAQRDADVDTVISEELATLSEAQRAIWPKVLRGDTWNIDRLLAIMERRAKLLGLDYTMREAPPASSAQILVAILDGRDTDISAAADIDPRSLASAWRGQPALQAG